MTNLRFVLFITFIAALGGFLFGFDTAVISGAIPFIKDYFQLDEIQEGWAVACVIVGCMMGAGSAGYLSDRHGRKKVLIITGLMFAVSAIGTAFATNFTFFIILRLIGGIGVGAASVLSPTYISEIAPAAMRGRLVSLNQLAIVVGILIVYFTNYLFLNSGDNNWRWMLASEVFPAGLFIFFLFFIPESPRWLVKNGQEEKAKDVLMKVGGKIHVENSLIYIKESLVNANRVKFSEIFEGRMKKILLIGVLLACFQQITGINAIIYYAPTIFLKAGASTESAFWQPVIIGLVNLSFTFVAIWLIDKVGRKVLMLFGSAGMAISLSFLVYAFYTDNLQGYGVLISILGYIASFAASLAPVVWVLVAELYPNRLRGTAMSFSIFLHWSCTFLVVQTFPWVLANLGGAFSFGIFGILSIVTFVFIYFWVPETKGKSLEEIEKEIN